jgi:hypothetical protein
MKGYRDDFNVDNDALVNLIVSLERQLWDTPTQVERSIGEIQMASKNTTHLYVLHWVPHVGSLMIILSHAASLIIMLWRDESLFLEPPSSIGFVEYSSRVYIGASVGIGLSTLVLGANGGCSSLHVS